MRSVFEDSFKVFNYFYSFDKYGILLSAYHAVSYCMSKSKNQSIKLKFSFKSFFVPY